MEHVESHHLTGLTLEQPTADRDVPSNVLHKQRSHTVAAETPTCQVLRMIDRSHPANRIMLSNA